MADAMLNAMDRQAQSVLDHIGNPLVLLRYMHLAAAMPERSTSNLLLVAGQSSDVWTLDSGGSGTPIWISEWQKDANVPAQVPKLYHAGTPESVRAASGAARLEEAVRALGVKPAEDRKAMGRQFTQEALRQMRDHFREEYACNILPSDLDIQAQGAAYILAAHYCADISGAGFSGLFDEGAVKPENALETLGGMSAHSRSFQRQLDRAGHELTNALTKHQTQPRRTRESSLPKVPQTLSFRLSAQR